MNIPKLLDWCERSVVFSFYALIYFLPISTALVEIFSTIIAFAYLIKRLGVFVAELSRIDALKLPRPFLRKREAFLKSFRVEPNLLNLPIAVFMAVNFLSSVFSQAPSLSFKAFIFKLLQEVILYYAFVEYVRTKKQLQVFTSIYLVSGSLIVINGLVEYFKGKGFIHGNLLQGGRVISSFNHPNDLGSYLIVIIILVLAFLMRRRNSESEPVNFSVNGTRYFFMPIVQLSLLLLLVASLFCMGLTFSRGAWIGLLLGLLYLAIIRRDQFYIPVAVALIFFTIFVPKLEQHRKVTFTSDNTQEDPATVLLRVKQAEKAKFDKSLFAQKETFNVFWEMIFPAVGHFTGAGRKAFWQEALSIIEKFPYLGAGLNTYSEVAPKYGYPHNCYLQLAAETGLIGLAAFIWILFRLFYHSIINIFHAKDSFLNALLGGGAAGLFGFLSHSFVDTTFYSVQLGVLLWVLMAVLVVAQKLDK